jgi:hypothetical protein
VPEVPATPPAPDQVDRQSRDIGSLLGELFGR